MHKKGLGTLGVILIIAIITAGVFHLTTYNEARLGPAPFKLTPSGEGTDSPGNITPVNGTPTQITPSAVCSTDSIPIKTPQDLYFVRINLNGSYCQMNDIDLTGWNWEPLGSDSVPFKGTYNGNGYNISNLFSDGQVGWEHGIFGAANGAIFKNIKIVNPQLINNEDGNYGSLAGLIRNGTLVQNVYVFNPFIKARPSVSAGGLVGVMGRSSQEGPQEEHNKIINSASYGGSVNVNNVFYVVNFDALGGLVGRLSSSDSSIYNSSSSTNVNGIDPANGHGVWATGGLVGNSYWPLTTDYVIQDSFATGNVSGMVSGGLVGIMHYGHQTHGLIINNSYATGLVTGGNYGSNSQAGGLVGNITNGDITDQQIINSYSKGLVQGLQQQTILGGLIARGAPKVNSSYWDTQTSGQTSSAGGEGRNTSEMTSVPRPTNTYVNWNFNSIWTQVNGQYPTLR